MLFGSYPVNLAFTLALYGEVLSLLSQTLGSAIILWAPFAPNKLPKSRCLAEAISHTNPYGQCFIVAYPRTAILGLAATGYSMHKNKYNSKILQ